jgi:phosphoserine aminotransferase
MECVLRNLVRRESFHLVHGAFSRRFQATAAEIGLEVVELTSPWSAAVPWREARIPATCELVAVTHTETSSGLAWPADELKALRRAHPRPLLAVDATSAASGVVLPWEAADVWFFSVQKCLGLPAGLGLVLAGPRALAAAAEPPRAVAAWQSLPVLVERMERGETVETPNVLAIALLAKRLARLDLAAVAAETGAKAELLYGATLPWRPFVEAVPWRSPTVGNFVVEDPAGWHARAAAAGFQLGRGYGELRDSCVRIANFPATSRADLRELLAGLAV